MLLLEPYRATVDRQLAALVDELPANDLSRAIAYAFESGGKRLRPAIVLMMAETLGAPAPLWPAATVECFHIASLIADDLPCMDDAALRRDRPSLHKAFGESTALLSSYALISEGYGALERQRVLDPTAHTACLHAYAIAARNIGCHGLIGGQYDDIRNAPMDEEQLLQCSWMKTGALFEIAFVFGWLFGRGDAQRLDMVRKLAKHYATAFQIADDLIDQEEDAQLQRTVNYALATGVQRAKERIAEEAHQYLRILDEMGLNSPNLRGLMHLVQAT